MLPTSGTWVVPLWVYVGKRAAARGQGRRAGRAETGSASAASAMAAMSSGSIMPEVSTGRGQQLHAAGRAQVSVAEPLAYVAGRVPSPHGEVEARALLDRSGSWSPGSERCWS